MAARPAAGGGRWVTVGAERLQRWLDGFAARHGEPSWTATPDLVEVLAPDGASAACEVPFPPLAEDPHAPYAGLVAHAVRRRRVGVLLVRRGGYATGVFDGPDLVASKVGSRPVQGRSAAGGWSQQRFARRRAGQAQVALGAAADVAARVLLPAAAGADGSARLDGLVLGGDRRAVAEVLEDPRLTPLRPLVTGRFLDVPDPRLAVLAGCGSALRAVHVRVRDPA